MAAIPLAAAGAVLFTMFDPRAVARAVARADAALVLLAMAVGAMIEIVRAQRAALMLRREHRITLEQSFGAVVLSHAACRIIPIGPAGFGLQSLLARRLANIPMPFSAGVFIACSILERMTAIPVIAFVLLAVHIPDWVRFLLLGTLAHTVLLLCLPLIAALTRHRVGKLTPRSRWGRRIHGAISDVESGLATIVAGGWRIALPAIGLSFLITAGSVLRLTALLAAFKLNASTHQVALLMVMGGLVGSMPVTIPGADAWATSKFLRLVHLLRPGAGGFVLLSSVIATIEAPLLAAGMLLWWSLPRSDVSLRLGELYALAWRPRRTYPPSPDAV
jgi:uncharacterized protein (TIRG00374 family)